ncbi:MAG: ABC-2 transporter permease [Lysinibacillus sp.]
MLALLKLQWQLRKKMLLFYLAIIIGIGVFLSTKIDTMQLTIICYFLSVSFLSNSFFVSSNHFYRLLAIMPIAREKVVKSIALLSLLFIIMTFSIILPFQLKNNITENLSFFLGFFACAIVCSAIEQYFLFTNEKPEIGFGENMLSMLGSIIILIPHALLYLIEHEPTIYLRLLIAPILAVVFYYWRMKGNIAYFEKKEIF